jgi:NAD(P)-dependent dehydrogenase (short-subunit alcohol dehydrogenase family)
MTARSTKEFVEVSEVAAFVAFLCSTEAKSITGAGWTAH